MDLVGQLVKLRAPREEDASAIVEGLADPNVTRHLGSWSRAPYGIEEALGFVRRHDPRDFTWAIECLADSAFVGMTALHDLDFRNRNCMWGIWIAPPDRWGHGFGTEACELAVTYAFRELGMERVYLEVYQGNERGRRAYEKAGFTLEGTLRRHVWREGRFVDSHLMAVLKDHPLYRV